MKIALGFKAHSGWAALAAIGASGGRRDRDFEVVDRRRVELVEADEAHWAKQPYHAAVELGGDEGREAVRRGTQSARRHAVREMRSAIERASGAGHEIAACGVLMAEPMPGWTVEEILAVHFRMHKAEGVLFRDALARAAAECGLNLVAIPEKRLKDEAARALARPWSRVQETIRALGKPVGPPWGQDQKEAALGAMIALSGPA